MAPASSAVYQLKITLSGSRPPIWRRLLIEPTMTFQDLHQIIQLAMGWHCTHLHQFQLSGGTLIGDPEEDPDGMMNYTDEASIPLDAALVREKQRLRYDYDFGDGWEHEVLLERVLPDSGGQPVPSCLKAVRQCPPEDVGGIFGFYDFLEAATDAAHPEHESVKEWMGGESFDPEFVDLDAINESIAQRDRFFGTVGSAEPWGREGFHGLEPAQVEQLLMSPLHCPAVFQSDIDLAAAESSVDSVPIVRMLKALSQALGDKGIRLTPKGNLPVKAVMQLMEAGGEGVVPEPYRSGFSRIRSEEDVVHVHLTRVLADVAGFTRKQRGQLLLKKRVISQSAKRQWLMLYRELFEAALSHFNWGWLDGIEGCDDVQVVGPFVFWLLALHGDEWRDESYYIDAMLKAFPMLPMSAPANSFLGPEKEVALALKLRLFSLCERFGLIERNHEKAQRVGLDDGGKIKRTPLFECLFNVAD